MNFLEYCVNKLCVAIFKCSKWTVKGTFPKEYKKLVIVAAPHTSNWDGIFAKAALSILGVKYNFAIKSQLMRFPLNLFFSPMGAISINRAATLKKKNLVSIIAEQFNISEQMYLVIAPEGTRKKANKLKTGFYHIAKQANVPILLTYLDYNKKEAGIGPVFFPSENIDDDLYRITQFYKSIPGKFPEQGIL